MSTPERMSTPEEVWSSVEILAEPTRRKVFDAVRTAPGPVTREAIAVEVEIGTRLAAFHLDRLAEAGLLTIDYARPEGCGGPGAGRPAKRYAPAPVAVELSVPPRRYNLVARILAAAIAVRPDAANVSALTIARRSGEDLGAQFRRLRRRRAKVSLPAAAEALESMGYEPVMSGDGSLRLRNCPFHDVVDVAPELVCGLNEQLVSGVLDGMGLGPRCEARLSPNPPDCCVSVRAL
jgi:predicted ArsR family transcriptional regulator